MAFDTIAAGGGDADTNGHGPGGGNWTFLTNHAHVLGCVVAEPGIRLRDVATRVGITERAAQRIVGELVAAGYLERERVGRRNVYRVDLERPLRHPLDAHASVAELLTVVGAR